MSHISSVPLSEFNYKTAHTHDNGLAQLKKEREKKVKKKKNPDNSISSPSPSCPALLSCVASGSPPPWSVTMEMVAA